MNTDNLSPDDIQRLLAAAAVEPGDTELLARVRARVAGELAGGAARPRRNWIPMIAAIAVPAAAAAALGGVLLLHLQPVATRTPVPAVESSPTPSVSPLPSPLPSPSGGPGTAVPISQLRMFPGVRGWATSATGGTVYLYTTQGGPLWQRSILPGPGVLQASDFIDGTHAWVVMAPGGDRGSGGEQATLFQTVDAGTSWAAAGPAFTINFASTVQFVDARHGWITSVDGAAAGSNALTLYRTTDGGASWTVASRAVPGSTPDTGTGKMPSSCDKNPPVFANASDGYLTGTCAGPDPVFYVSHDGGSSWVKSTLPLAGLTTGYVTNCQCNTAPPRFVSATDGYLLLGGIVEAGPLNTLYVTHDAGKSWFGYMVPAQPAIDPAVDGSPFVKLITRPNGGAFGSTSPPDSLLASGDDGKNWHQVNAPAHILTATILDFADSLTGWAVVPVNPSAGPASPAELWLTKDGGTTWSNMDFAVAP